MVLWIKKKVVEGLTKETLVDTAEYIRDQLITKDADFRNCYIEPADLSYTALSWGSGKDVKLSFSVGG